MVTLITTSREDVPQELREANPSWSVLNESNLSRATESLREIPSHLHDKTLILPYNMVNRRLTGTRSRMLLAYLMVQSRQRVLDFYIVAPSRGRVDLRISRMIDREVEWYKG